MPLSDADISEARRVFLIRKGDFSVARVRLRPAFDYHVTTKTLLALVADKHGFTPEEVCGARRFKHLVAARHEWFYECLARTRISVEGLAERYGFHHTTVLYGAAKHQKAHKLRRVTRYDYETKANETRLRDKVRYRDEIIRDMRRGSRDG